MKIIVYICSLMLAGVLASTGYEGSGSSYGGSGYGEGPPHHGDFTGYHFNYEDMEQLQQMIFDVDAEKHQLAKKVKMLKDQKVNLLDKLDAAKSITIPGLIQVQDQQDATLHDIKAKLKELSHEIFDQVAALDGEVAVSKRQESFVNGVWGRIFELVASNHKQSAMLAKASRFLDEEKEKLNAKLEAHRLSGQAMIDELKYNTKALSDLVSTRRCLSDVAVVYIDPKQRVSDAVIYFPDHFFGTLVPTAYCALQGLTSTINLDKSDKFPGGPDGYGGYGNYGYSFPDKYQNLALTVDCKPFNDKVVVSAFDQSKGTGNVVEKVYVAVKLCTFGPQSSGAKHPYSAPKKLH